MPEPENIPPANPENPPAEEIEFEIPESISRTHSVSCRTQYEKQVIAEYCAYRVKKGLNKYPAEALVQLIQHTQKNAVFFDAGKILKQENEKD